MLLYRLLFAATVLALLCVGQGCTTTEFSYRDPQRPEADITLKRTTFLRHGSVTVDFPINAQVRIEDKPVSKPAAGMALGLGCIVGTFLGIPAGPLGRAGGCLGGGVVGGLGSLLGSDDNEPVEEAPPLRPSEKPPYVPAPTSMRVPDPALTGPVASACLVPSPPAWCQP